MKQASCERCGYELADQVWYGYGIKTAVDILKKAPRAAVTLQPTDLDMHSIQESVTDTERHVHHVDARFPCIAVPFRKRWRVIDGNHRAAKQLRRNRPVRAYLLTAKEARKVKTNDYYI